MVMVRSWSGHGLVMVRSWSGHGQVMSPHHIDQMFKRSLEVESRVAPCMPKVKVPGSWRLSVGSWRVSVFCRFLGVISGSLSVSVCSWRLYVGSWRSSAVPGGYLVQGVLLSCSGQLKNCTDCTDLWRSGTNGQTNRGVPRGPCRYKNHCISKERLQLGNHPLT